MTPDDPRHGTYAGAVQHYKRHEPACAPCAASALRYSKRRKYDAHRGEPRLVPIVGYRRRIQALQAIGHNLRAIAAELGITPGTFSNRFYRSDWISRANHEQMVEVYERLCMTPNPFATRTLGNARRKGYVPPLAWDDIDDPNERPRMRHTRPLKTDIDPVVVQRVLAGDRLRTTHAEKLEITAKWEASGRSLNELERVTGWKSDRYTVREAS